MLLEILVILSICLLLLEEYMRMSYLNVEQKFSDTEKMVFL